MIISKEFQFYKIGVQITCPYFTYQEITYRKFPELENLNVNRPSNTKLWHWVMQACATNKIARCTGAAHLL